ncbi:putative rrm domain protein [Erysiphe necator]|uniref:Putative rrm domain protein n=1 Tax=Uncinula necator TaxID=52586 RepID=A0A0B1PBA0_UNCNE|nr:putative rrm domain protein [Erysiphe necator]
MLFIEEDAPLLKKWIVKRLENTSDADADVLADYVLALLRHDGDDETVRALCESEIPDFLKEDSVLFVRDVFDAINYKKYLPSAKNSRKISAPFDPPTGPSALQVRNHVSNYLNGNSNSNKKRSYNDRIDSQVYERGYVGGNHHESNKFQRRAGPQLGTDLAEANKGGEYNQNLQPYMGLPNILSQYSGIQESMPNSSPKVPTFDPIDPVTAMIAMQALTFPIPGTNPFGQIGFTAHNDPNMSLNKQRCRDYDVKGFCARGITCKFEHGENPLWNPSQSQILSEEYDPSNSIMTSVDLNGAGKSSKSEGVSDNTQIVVDSEGRRKSKARRGELRQTGNSNRRGGRSEFSSDRPNFDKTKTTIVVENIPEENFNEDNVRSFFTQFGTIVEISLYQYKRLAILKYDSWNSANLAYKSPKVIFDNRFVKVYWFDEHDPQLKNKDDSISGTINQKITGAPIPARETSEPKIDLEEFARKQQEAQELHIEKQKKRKEMEAAKKELEIRQEELLKCQAEEKRKLMERIAAKERNRETTLGLEADSLGSTDKSSSQTEALKAQLAALEAEAQLLGIDTSLSETNGWSPRGRGRGRGRGRIYSGHRGRGGYRGRGAAPFVLAGSLPDPRSFNLDNRPKKIGLTGVDFSDPEKDENLKQYLLVSNKYHQLFVVISLDPFCTKKLKGIGEYEDIEVTPSRTIITFKDRRTAESFMFGSIGGEIPSVGKVEMSWISTLNPSHALSRQADTIKSGPERGGDAAASATGTSQGTDMVLSFKAGNQQNTNANMDYDVAYENEWGPE